MHPLLLLFLSVCIGPFVTLRFVIDAGCSPPLPLHFLLRLCFRDVLWCEDSCVASCQFETHAVDAAVPFNR
jgi:hypothetical protein